MGTRASILIEHEPFINFEDTDLKDSDISYHYWLYRHYDGYPAETGSSLIFASNFVMQALLEKDAINAAEYGRLLKKQILEEDHYEKTSMMHSDIEWFYHFKFFSNPKKPFCNFRIRKREIGEDAPSHIFYDHKAKSPQHLFLHYMIFNSELEIEQCKIRSKYYQKQLKELIYGK